MDLEKLNRRPWGKGSGKKIDTNREGRRQTMRLLNIENKLRVDGGGGGDGKMGDGH